MESGDALDRLQRWYLNQCNGDWEHSFGVEIGTLDNPGWRVKVDLKDTTVATGVFERLEFERSDDDWLRCWVDGEIFEIACGPLNLSEGLEVFLGWVGSSHL